MLVLIIIAVITLVVGVMPINACKPQEKTKLSIICFKGYTEDEWVPVASSKKVSHLLIAI